MQHRTWHWAAMLTVLLAIALASLGSGVIHIGPREVVDALAGSGDPTLREC